MARPRSSQRRHPSRSHSPSFSFSLRPFLPGHRGSCICTRIYTRTCAHTWPYIGIPCSRRCTLWSYHEGRIGKNRSLTTTDATEHTIVCGGVACRVEHTKLPPSRATLPPSFFLSLVPVPPPPRSVHPGHRCRRFDAWIPVCHSTCNTAYWLVLDDPSRHKTPAHRSSTLNAPDAVANFDEVCAATKGTRRQGRGGLGKAIGRKRESGVARESITPPRFARYRKWNASIIPGREDADAAPRRKPHSSWKDETLTIRIATDAREAALYRARADSRHLSHCCRHSIRAEWFMHTCEDAQRLR